MDRKTYEIHLVGGDTELLFKIFLTDEEYELLKKISLNEAIFPRIIIALD